MRRPQGGRSEARQRNIHGFAVWPMPRNIFNLVQILDFGRPMQTELFEQPMFPSSYVKIHKIHWPYVLRR